MKQNKNKPKFINRIISAVLSTTLLVTGVPIPTLKDGFHFERVHLVNEQVALADDTEPPGITENLFDQSATITITSPTELKNFSWWYNKYGDSSDTINVNIAITSASTYNGVNYIDIHDGFTSIGTDARPFNGTITLTNASLDTFYLFKPFFGTVNQSTKISNESGNVRNVKFLCSMGYTGDSYAMPTPHAVFANKIVNTSPETATQMECSVELTTVSAASGENVKEKDISGIIGTIDSDASVKINLTNNGVVTGTDYIVDVTGSGAIGLLCDTMKTNSVLTANIISDGTNTTYKVTSSDGSAGGLVGTMGKGAALIIQDSENAGFASVDHTVSGTYCGNLVGSAENAYIGKTVPASIYPLDMTIGSAVKISSTATLNGTSGNGHLFGYYKVSDETVEGTTYKNCTITLDLSSMQVKSAKGNAGGLIGELEFASTAAESAADSPVFTINGGAGVTDDTHTGTKNLTLAFTGNNNGGLIGIYKTSSLKNTLNISNVYTSLTGTANATVGGLIGKIDDTNSAAYVKIEKTHTEGNKGGGLIGTAGGTDTKGSFVDIVNYNKINGASTAGIIATMAYGVLRLSGTTDLTGLTSGNMILNSRDSALVYSNGTGNDATWTLKRPSINYDDIGTWGEVFRLTGIISETNLASAHTVSIPASPVSTENTEDSNPGPITTLADFAKLALNIQHNTGNTSAALIIDGANTSKSSNILNSNIYLDGTFNLSGTGITGLTRDGGTSEQVFTGSLTGGTVQLAVGEHYGNNEPAEGNGRIYRHRWSGLFSAISGATITNLTVSGSCDKKPSSKDVASFFGCVAGKYKGSTATSLTNVTSTVSCSIPGIIDNSISVFGGMIGGVADDATGTLSFNGCNSSAKIADGTGLNNFFGGYIALVDRKGTNASAITINFGSTTKCTVGGGTAAFPNYSNSTAKTRPLYGGLIGVVRGTNAHSIATTINVSNVEVSNLIINSSLTGSSPDGAGGLLGYAWYDAEVSIPKLAVSGSSITATGGSGNLGGLVYAGTGHWTVCGAGNDDTVTITSSSFNGSGSLGLLVTRAFNEVQLGKDDEDYTADNKAALYLELKNQVKYDPSGASVSSPSVFDEIVAYSVNPSESVDITDNGNAIVSINTDGSGTGVTMSGSACNTYQNKTSYGKNTRKTNGNTRYYYNLDTIRSGSPSDAEKLLLWSVQQYAHSSIAGHNYFGTSFTPSGTTLDMTGLSYYTIDYANSFPFSNRNFSLTFYNKEIETGESGTGNTDNNPRSTVSTSSQHYMMHCGLFRNAPANSLTLGSVTLSGNVGKYNGGSGFIISGKLGGDASVTSQFSDTGITLNGAYIYTGDNAIAAGSYAPLLLNSVGKNADLKIKNVSTSGYTSFSGYAASSLIGKVGADDASDSNMNIEFSGITLDARKTANDFSGQDFNTIYGSTKSIFSNATLLQHYIYSGTDSKGVYNYRWDEDWTNNQHHVTYGAEIDNTIDNRDSDNVSEQRNYFGSDKYTHPTNNNAASAYGNFASKFIPYVANIGNSNSDNIHELRVNIPVVNLTDGCGTYNDPYVIKTPKQLYTAADLIKTASFSDTTFQINLPSSISDNLHWCNPATGDTPEHKAFQLNSENTPQFVNGNTKFTREAVRKYLAGAYFLIDDDLILANDFPGLGAGTTGDYAFRGVIVGKNNGTESTPDYPTITLTNGVPFVYNSNGCVIKNLDFVKGTIAIGTQSDKAQFQYDSGCLAYGGIINKIMGGDNIIDHVGITYNSTVTSGGSGTYLHTIPIGGYVGVILNGGLFFRNMDDVTNTGITSFSASGNNKYLYRNPIIGRVLNGYAVCEDCDALDNGDKNYYISELDSSITDKLTVTSNSITANNAQSWFVLSLLVNSGTLSDKTLYINSDSKTRHLGKYNDVGCLNTKTSATIEDTEVFTAGAETGSVAPYLMRHYTANQTTWLNTTSAYAITMGGGTWTLDKGYRGIGGFNGYDTGSAIDGSVSKNCNNTCIIQVSGITGNSTTINLDMKHLGYRHEVRTSNGTYAETQENYSTTENGFGLFNLFTPSQNNVTVENIILSGTVYSEYVDKDTGEVFHNYPDSKNNWNAYYAWTITNSRRLSAGMFAGAKSNTSNKVTLSNISLNSVNVHSGKHAGGFIGNAANVTLSACPATNVSSFGRSSVGGLIGYASDNSKVSGAEGGTAVTIYAITEQAKGYSNTTGKEGRYSGVGGLVGMSTAITIENINLSSVAGGLVQYDNLGSDDSSYVGGILGMSRGAITIQNCNVNQISVLGTANRVGGLAGGTLGKQTLTASNVTIDGGNTATLTCTGKESVGGVIGYSSAKVSLTDVIIRNYTIQKNDINESSANAMGGLVGSLYSDLDMKNVLIANCALERLDTSGSNPNLAAGGIIGRSSTITIRGYNVVLRDISINNTLNSDGKYKGNFIGVGTPSNYKIVGLSLQGTLPTNKLINNTTTNPTADAQNSKYIIFSDYNGTNLPAANTDGSGSAPKLNDSTALGDSYVKSPYALVNPRVNIDSANELTGDGMANTVSGLPIQNIVTDKNKTTGKPNKAYTVAYSGSIADFNLSDFDYEYADANLGQSHNFAVLNVETLSHADSHNQINSYLQLLTNTNYNFGTNVSGVYKVDIYKMQLKGEGDSKKFEKVTTGVHLKIDSENRFYMAGGEDVDTAENDPTFSLIDISFYDPTSTNTVAYHLYVPVIAKKLMKYTFELATGNGTPYNYAWYTANQRFDDGVMLAENIGSSGTLYFKYTYQRTKKEWQAALDYGENFLSNYDKVLSLAPINESEYIKAFPSGTQLVLVDANRGGKAYYSTVGNAMSGNKLTLYSTPTATSSNPNPSPTYTFYQNNNQTGDGFTPIPINDLLYITATTNGSGKYAVYNAETDANDATKAPKVSAYIGNATTPTLFRDAQDGDTKYKLTIVNSMENKTTTDLAETDTIEISERYYLSFFTDKSLYAQENETPTPAKPALTTAIHYYTVTSDRLINGPASAKYSTTPDTKQVLFANLFNQNNVHYYTENPNPESGLDPEEINSVMNSVKVKLEANIQLTPEANSAVSGQLSTVNMYQSFLVYLTKNDGNEHDRAILGNPTAYADITISSTNNHAIESLTHDATNKYASVGMDYVEVSSNIPIGPFISGGTVEKPAVATIGATAVITYTSTAQQEAQFPARKDKGESEKNATVSAYSNIGFEEGKTALSKNQTNALHKGAGYNDYKYYIISQTEPTLDIYAYASDGQRYGQLGINANDLPDNTGKVHISAAAEFDVRPIAASVKNATHVKFTVSLQQKQQTTGTFNYSEYTNIDDIDAYLYNINMDLTDVVSTNDGTTYTFIVPRDKVVALDDAVAGKTYYMRMPISFDVYTGSDAPVDSNGNAIIKDGAALGSFESRGLVYANYKFKVTAQMLSSANANAGVGASAPSELVYTNAKLLGDYIKVLDNN